MQLGSSGSEFKISPKPLCLQFAVPADPEPVSAETQAELELSSSVSALPFRSHTKDHIPDSHQASVLMDNGF